MLIPCSGNPLHPPGLRSLPHPLQVFGAGGLEEAVDAAVEVLDAHV